MAYAEKRGKGPFPWRVRFKRPDGTWDSAPGFATKEAALKHGRAQETDIDRGIWIDPRKSAIPFGEVARGWFAENPRAANTDDTREYLLDRVIGPRWDSVPIAEVLWYPVKTWANALAISRNTVDSAVSLMSTIMSAASDANLIASNPLAGRRRRSANLKDPVNVEPKPTVWPQAEQAAAVAARMGAVPGLMEIAQYVMGPRFGELAAVHRERSLVLRTDMIDGRPWTRRVLSIPKDRGAVEYVKLRNADPEETRRRVRRLASPKSNPSVREVDIPPFLDLLLDAHLQQWPHEFVFATSRGTLRSLSDYNRTIKAATDGWPTTDKRKAAAPILPGLSSHGNRHGHATWMADVGLQEALRRYVLGQRAAGMAGVYEHPTPAMRKARVDLLERLWARPGVGDVYLSGPRAIRASA